jgi:nucleotide-binding universal stress UspA family protein
MAKPRVVVGVDGSSATDAVLAVACRQADLLGATLHVVHAWSRVTPGPGKTISVNGDARAAERSAFRTLEEALRRAEWCPDGKQRSIRREAVHGGAATSLLMAAEGADLLVVGNRRGRSGMVLGLTAQDVAVNAPCPVLLVPVDAANSNGSEPEPPA